MTADRWGNMASVVHSVFNVYGSRISVPGYGFVLHDRGSGFTRDQSSPNAVAPRKQPFHTIITAFVMKDGEPLMEFGNMNGSIQAYSHTTHLINMIDLGFNPQASADAARYTHSQSSTGPGTVSLENNLRALVGAGMQAMGHPVSNNNPDVGGMQGIYFKRDFSLPEPVQPPEGTRWTPFERKPPVRAWTGGEWRVPLRLRSAEGWPRGGLVVHRSIR